MLAKFRLGGVLAKQHLGLPISPHRLVFSPATPLESNSKLPSTDPESEILQIGNLLDPKPLISRHVDTDLVVLQGGLVLIQQTGLHQKPVGLGFWLAGFASYA